MSSDDKIINLLNNIHRLTKETNYTANEFKITKNKGFEFYFISINVKIKSMDFMLLLEKVEQYILKNRSYTHITKKYYKPVKKYTLK